MSMQLSRLGDKVTISSIGTAFKRFVNNPEIVHPRSQNHTTIALSCPVDNIHDGDLVTSRHYTRWTAEYRIRPRRNPSFDMSTVGFFDKSGAEFDLMYNERSIYLKGLTDELQNALAVTRYDTKNISVRISVAYGMMTIYIDLCEKV